MKFNEEQIKKAAECKNIDELLELAKTEGIELAKEEAEKLFASLKDEEVNLDDVKKVAGGFCAGDVCGANC